MVEGPTSEREVGGSILTKVAVLLLFIVSAVVGTSPEGVFLRLGSTDVWYIYTGLQYLQGSLKV